MKRTTIALISFIISFFTILSLASQVYAQPYGTGKYNSAVPYGSQTSLSITTSGNVSVPITPTTTGTLATGTSDVTITSTDVTGYKLYIRALNNTNMDNLGTPLPASANNSPAALALNTWGYNTDASNNFVGITINDTMIKSLVGPASSGDITHITYGMKLDLAKPAGNYTATIVYTAVPQTN
ncbi:MAG: hypothetical protein WCJ36_00915 [Candidatus Saccharibacteria bacterium]